MFPSEMSLFDISPFGTGLMITVAALVILYLVVLVKLNPSTEGGGITEKDVPNQRILEEPLTERRVKPTMFNEVEEKAVESIERQELVSPAPVKTEKTIGVQGCPHYFGYLGGHPKNTPIPNECLTCIKIMECLSKVE